MDTLKQPELVIIGDGQWITLRHLLIDGADDATVARRRGVAVSTVKMDLKRIYARLDLASRTELAVLVWSGRVDLISRKHGSLFEALRTELAA